VFIGGDAQCLQFGFNQEEFEALQVSVMAKFEETEVESDRAWKALCAAHDMVSSGRANDEFALRFRN
jgi:hypothetical protein